MDVTKGLIGRRVCAGIEVALGDLLGICAMYNAGNGFVDIVSLLASAGIILTGCLGIPGKIEVMVTLYLDAGIICALYLGYSALESVAGIVAYYHERAARAAVGYNLAWSPVLIVETIIVTLAFIVSVLGVFFAAKPWCGNRQGQYGAQQYNNDNAHVGAAGPPNHIYSNTVYVDTTQTRQYNYGNTSAGTVGPPNYNHSNTAI